MAYLARFLYELLLALSLPLAAAGWIRKMCQRNGLGTGIKQRFGFYDQLAESANKGGIYIHAVSVGEVQIALKLIKELSLSRNSNQPLNSQNELKLVQQAVLDESEPMTKNRGAQCITDDTRAPRQSEEEVAIAKINHLNNHFTLAVTTSTAWWLAHDTIKNSSSLEAKVTLIYAPFDFSILTRSVLQRFAPKQLILIESELWPNLLYSASKLDIPAVLINARLSDKSYSRMLKYKQLINKIGQAPHWMSLEYISVSFDRDVERWQQLGFKTEQLHLTGNIKYDNCSIENAHNPNLTPKNELKLVQQAVLDESEPMTKNRGAQCITNDTRAPRQQLPSNFRQERSDALAKQVTSSHQSEEELAIAKSNHFTICLVSSHADEELLLMAFIAELREELAVEAEEEQTQTPELEFIIIPRHVERCPDIVEHLAEYDFELNRDYQLVNKTGQVAQWLERSDLAIIGKSFLKKGGQNPIEPLQHNVPIICGPYMSNFEPLISELKEANAISYCSELPKSENHELADMHEQVRRSIKQHISYPQIAQQQLQAAHQVLAKHQGATAKAAALIES